MGTPISPATFVPGVWNASGSGCTGVVLTGPAGKPAGKVNTPCSTTANEAQRFYLTQQNPTQGNQYTGGGGGSVLINDEGMANYNGLISSIQHRLSSTFSLLANYTWSKCMNIEDAQGDLASTTVENPNNPAMDYAPCGSDYRNVENIVMVATSRFHIDNRFASLAANGWTFAPLIHIASGAPFSVTSGVDNSYTDVGNDRPNLVAGASVYTHLALRAGTGSANRGYLNTAAFAQVCPTGATPLTCAGYGTYGDIGRNTFRGPTAFQFDAQISRVFPIYERLNATFRLEAFNVLNHPIFANPTAGLSSSTFGQISALATNTNARLFQGSVKLIF